MTTPSRHTPATLALAISLASSLACIAIACTSGVPSSSGGLDDGGSSGSSGSSGSTGSSGSSSGSSGTSGSEGGKTTTSRVDRTAFPSTCSKGLAGLTPAGAFDSIEVRVTLDPRQDAGSGPPYTVQGTRGTPCATAASSAACKVNFDAASVTTSAWSTNDGYSGGAQPPPARYAYYVVTRGDAVVTIANATELAAFLAPIDTPTEAIDMRRGPLGGESVCKLIRTDGDGYAFLEEGCGPFDSTNYTKTEIVTKVSRSGAVTTELTAGPFPDPMLDCAPKP